MSKNCYRHECLEKELCPDKYYLGKLALCGTTNLQCPKCAPNPYGRYDFEDVLF